MDLAGTGINNHAHAEVLRRIENALEAAARSISSFVPGSVKSEYKCGDALVTEADRVANRVLHDTLRRDTEGWLSEESVDDLSRLGKERVWVVDPLDGTREFVAGIPEWCISVAMIENGRPIAGGVCNPATGEIFLGAAGLGVTRNGKPVRTSDCKNLSGAVVLASRSETERGEWDCFRQSPFVIRPTGSVAYKLALVAAGAADATWTLCPKHEWDIAAGVALILAAGGFAQGLGSGTPTFNNRVCLLPNLLAAGPSLAEVLRAYLQEHTARCA